MSWNVTPSKGGEGGSAKPPVGNHLAVLVGIFDMGHQLDDFDQDNEKWQHRAYFVWELVGEQIEGTSKNHVIGIDLTLSLNEKAKLRKWIEARTGKQLVDGAPFDVCAELGQACMLSVVEKKGYPKADSVAAVPKGVPVPKPGYKPTAISLEEFQNGERTIPEWCPWLYGSPLADHIRACSEIGNDRPSPRKASDNSKATQQPSGQPAKAPQAQAGRWDMSDGKVIHQNLTADEVQAAIESAGSAAHLIKVKPAGSPRDQAKPADQYGFAVSFDPIPF